MKMRFSTLSRDCGPLKRATECTQAEWTLAVKERRFMTVYHGETDWCTPVVGLVNHHGTINTMLKVVFGKPLPANITEIIGMRNSDEAFALCNP